MAIHGGGNRPGRGPRVAKVVRRIISRRFISMQSVCRLTRSVQEKLRGIYFRRHSDACFRYADIWIEKTHGLLGFNRSPRFNTHQTTKNKSMKKTYCPGLASFAPPVWQLRLITSFYTQQAIPPSGRMDMGTKTPLRRMLGQVSLSSTGGSGFLFWHVRGPGQNPGILQSFPWAAPRGSV